MTDTEPVTVPEGMAEFGYASMVTALADRLTQGDPTAQALCCGAPKDPGVVDEVIRMLLAIERLSAILPDWMTIGDRALSAVEQRMGAVGRLLAQPAVAPVLANLIAAVVTATVVETVRTLDKLDE